MNQRYSTLFLLILFNLLPLAGVLWWNWQVFDILLVYLGESLIVGLFNLPKMWLAGNNSTQSEPGAMRIFLIVFFLVHYNFFMAIQSLFVWVFLGKYDATAYTDSMHIGFLRLKWEVLFSLIALTISHLVSFLKNYVGKQEYLSTTLNKQMFAPYKRIFIQQLVVIVGGHVVMSYHQPIGMLSILVLLKTSIDAVVHMRQHQL